MYKVNFACLFFGYLNRNSHAHEHFTSTGTLPVPVHQYRGILRSLLWNKNLNAFLSFSFTPIYVSKEQICGHTHSNHYFPEKLLQRATSKHAIIDADSQRLGLSTGVKHHANFRCNRTALCFTTGLCSMLNTRFPDEL